MPKLQTVRFVKSPEGYREIVHSPASYRTIRSFLLSSRSLQSIFVVADSDGTVTITRQNTHSSMCVYTCWEFVCIHAKNPNRVRDRIRQMICMLEYTISGCYICAD